MTTRENTTVAASALAILVLAPFAGGCGAGFETNEAACERMMNYYGDCALGLGVPDEFDISGAFDLYVSQVCSTANDIPEGDWSALADCVTSFSCEQLTGEDPITDSEVFGNCFALVAFR